MLNIDSNNEIIVGVNIVDNNVPVTICTAKMKFDLIFFGKLDTTPINAASNRFFWIPNTVASKRILLKNSKIVFMFLLFKNKFNIIYSVNDIHSVSERLRLNNAILSIVNVELPAIIIIYL